MAVASGTPAWGEGLAIETLISEINDRSIDTVLVTFTDMQGRLQGKRVHGQFFVDEVLGHGTEGCNYLLAIDVEMNTVDGYVMSSWERGYGDFVMTPDLTTLRRIPWQPATAMVQCDISWEGGAEVVASPRQILRRQIARLESAALRAYAGTELEFIVFDETYESAWSKSYRDLVPSNQYNTDYSILGTSRVEPLLRDIRLGMAGAGLVVESAKGECNLGQHEIAFRYKEALAAADDHVVYKTGAKEIAAAHGKALTFMAKYNEREGNSCHIHLSLRGLDGGTSLASDADPQFGLSDAGRAYIAGQLAHLRELSLFFAPNINSYKRFTPGSFAPTAVKWGRDNRTCALRLVGHGQSLRLENRVPGGDVNPYLAIAGMIAAGLDGIERSLPLEPAFGGNAYVAEAARVPSSLAEAHQLWVESAWVRETFGADVQDHYANMALIEIDAFGSAVTDWERVRSFERM